eukprot:scaffold329521_cov81-Tisochrysis_lutea.AAC.1
MDYTYKAADGTSEDERRAPKGGASSTHKTKGAPGACKCGVQSRCVRGCPCAAASVECTSSCHGKKCSVKCERTVRDVQQPALTGHLPADDLRLEGEQDECASVCSAMCTECDV